MSDVQESPQGDEEVKDQPQGETQNTEAPQGDDVAKLKAESRKWEARAKKDRDELAALKSKIQQMVSVDEVASKEQALVDAQAKAETASRQASRYRIALAEGLPQDLAERLVGDTDEELREDAERLKALLKPQAPARDARGGQGAVQPDKKPDPNELLRLIAKR